MVLNLHRYVLLLLILFVNGTNNAYCLNTAVPTGDSISKSYKTDNTKKVSADSIKDVVQYVNENHLQMPNIKMIIGIILICAIVLAFLMIRLIRQKDKNEFNKFVSDTLYFFLILFACTFSILIGFATIEYFYHYSYTLSYKNNRATNDSSQEILSFVELLLTFLALGLAGFSGLLAAVGWIFRKKLEKIDDLEQIEKEVQSSLNASYGNIIVTADVALINLPKITFTQQIPSELLDTLKILNKLFKDHGKKLSFIKAFEDSHNGHRIHYARAIYLLGTRTSSSQLGSLDRDKEDNDTVISLLQKASETQDILLKRDVLIRLFQTYRELDTEDSFIKARETLDEIKKNLDDSEIIDILINWGQIILLSQTALKENNSIKKQNLYKESLIYANNLYTFIEKYETVWEDLGCGVSVIYYCAKSYWSFLFGCTEITEELKNQILSRFWRVTKLGIELFEKEINKGLITDKFISAIYHASYAYLLISYNNFPTTVAKNQTKIKTKIKNELNKVNKQIDFLLKDQAYSQNSGAKLIYSDHLERLSSLKDFQKYIHDLENFFKRKENIEAFYKGTN